MAKAKKESTESKKAAKPAESPKKAASPSAAKAAPAPAKAAPAAAPAAKGPAAKPSKAPIAAKSSKSTASKSGTPVPLVQTSFAAEVAAKMVAQRAAGDRPATTESSAAAAASAPRPESSTFRNLKEGLAKPGMSGLGGILGAPQNQKKSTQNYGGGNQIGRGQTFGAASKLNVPRRTGG